MAEHHYHETRNGSGRGTGTIAFIVGGLVVAVGLLFYFLFGGADMATVGGGTDVEINATADSAAGAASDEAAADDGAEAGAAATADTSGADAGAAATASE